MTTEEKEIRAYAEHPRLLFNHELVPFLENLAKLIVQLADRVRDLENDQS